jgi:diaminopimelate decarboxylase
VFDAHTHEFISTAHEDVKFGFSIASGAANEAIEKTVWSFKFFKSSWNTLPYWFTDI